MFIKNVTIHGFKSYHEKSSVGTFHEGFNVIIGRNGAGKSNFFSGVEFVLSDEYSNLRKEQRESLLYAGSSGTSADVRGITAYVELLIDNKSGRFPNPDNKDEFHLRRTITSKMDQFHLNGKLITRKELRSMLETAGFSSSNPYHIVKQGKISSLATCSDRTRLDIVRDLAGANVHDSTREQSIKMLQTCDTILGETHEVMGEMTERHKELEEDQKDLKEVKKLEKSKTCLEYLIFSKEIEDILSKVKNNEKFHTDLVGKMTVNKPSLEKTATEVEELKTDVEDKVRRYKAICEDLEENRKVLEQNLKKKAGAELAEMDLKNEDSDKENQEKKEKFDLELEDLVEQKRILEESLGQKVVKFDELKARLESLEHGKKEILEKRSKKFNSKKERNEWINSKIQEKKSLVEEKRLQVLEKETELKTQKSSIGNLEKEISQRKVEISEIHTAVSDLKVQLNTVEEEKSCLSTSVSEKMQKIHSLQVELDGVQEIQRTREAKLRSLPGMKQVFTGMQSINKLMQSNPELKENYYGIFLELFSCDDDLYIAVEQAVGMKLFHHVVSSDEVATKILKELNKKNLAGVFNFIPLNRIRVKDKRDLGDAMLNPNVMRLVDKVEYEEGSEDVMNFVFGGVLVCRNLEVGVMVSRQSQMLCVTLEGEKAESRGVLSGGHLPKDRNKIACYLSLDEVNGKVDEMTIELKKLQEELIESQSALMKRNKEVDRLKMNILRATNSIGKQEDDLKVALREKDRLFKQGVELEMEMSSFGTSIKLFNHSIRNLNQELLEDFTSGKSNDDKKRFKDLVKAIEETKKKFKVQNGNVEVAEKKLFEVDGEIEELKKSIQGVSDLILSSDNKQERLESLERNLAETQKLVEKYTDIVRDLTVEEVRCQNGITSARRELEEKEVALISLREDDISNTTALEKILEKKAHYQSLTKKYESLRKDLGGVDPALIQKNQKYSKSQMKTKLGQVMEEMKKFDHVNFSSSLSLKAFDQMEEKEQRIKDLNRDKKLLSKLISSLDSKREEQMGYTYKQMVKNFSEVFEKIVPNGRGELVLLGSPEGSQWFSEATGIQVRVTFTGKLIKISVACTNSVTQGRVL